MIKEYRKSAGLTQKQFSDLFGIPIDVVKSWDSRRRKPPEWAEKLIIEKLEKWGLEMNIYSEHYKIACVDIGNNGYKILKRKKYADIIKTTTIKRFKNGLGGMIWKDEKGLIVAEHTGTLDFEYYPLIGEVKETEAEQ